MCLPCEQDAEKFYKALSKKNNKIYLVYKDGSSKKIIEKEDFDTAIEIGALPKETAFEVL